MDDPRAAVHSLARRSLGPTQPVKAVPGYVAKSMRPEEAFRATLSDCLAQITANAATLRMGRSVDGLHQLRVAFRRLEVALGAFGREFGQDWLEELRGRAKILAGGWPRPATWTCLSASCWPSRPSRGSATACPSCAPAPKAHETAPGPRCWPAFRARISSFCR